MTQLFGSKIVCAVAYVLKWVKPSLSLSSFYIPWDADGNSLTEIKGALTEYRVILYVGNLMLQNNNKAQHGETTSMEFDSAKYNSYLIVTSFERKNNTQNMVDKYWHE